MAWLPTGIDILCIPLVPMRFDTPVEEIVPKNVHVCRMVLYSKD